MPTPPSTTGLVLRLDADSPFAVNADGTGGTPADGTVCRYWGDLSTSGANATATGVTGGPPLYVANALNGKPALNFAYDGSTARALNLGSPAALNAAESSNTYTVLFALKYSPWGHGVPADTTQYIINRGQGCWSHCVLNNANVLVNGPDYGRYGNPSIYSDWPIQAADSTFVTFGTVYDNSSAAPAALGGIERAYVNGFCRKAQNFPGTPQPSQPIILAALDLAGNDCWEGLVFAAYIYNRALSPAEVLQWDLYIRGQVGIPHPAASAPYILGDDGNSILGAIGIGYLMELLAAYRGLPRDHLFNLAWGGKTTTQMNIAAATDVDPLFAVLPAGPPKVFMYYEGTNEAGLDPAVIAAHLETYGTNRIAGPWGPRVIGTTPCPRQGGISLVTASADLRADFAGGVHWCNFLADLQAQVIMGNRANNANPTYYADGTHPTEVGDNLLVPLASAQIDLALAGVAGPIFRRGNSYRAGSRSWRSNGVKLRSPYHPRIR